MTFTIPVGALFFALGWAAGWGCLVVIAVSQGREKRKRGAK